MDNLRRREGTQAQQILLVTPKELLNAIKAHINPKKAPGFDLVTGVILKQLPKKIFVKLTHIYNAALMLKYVSSYWKAAAPPTDQ